MTLEYNRHTDTIHIVASKAAALKKNLTASSMNTARSRVKLLERALGIHQIFDEYTQVLNN